LDDLSGCYIKAAVFLFAFIMHELCNECIVLFIGYFYVLVMLSLVTIYSSHTHYVDNIPFYFL